MWVAVIETKSCFLYNFGIARVTSEENTVTLYKNAALGCCDHQRLFTRALKKPTWFRAPFVKCIYIFYKKIWVIPVI